MRTVPIRQGGGRGGQYLPVMMTTTPVHRAAPSTGFEQAPTAREETRVRRLEAQVESSVSGYGDLVIVVR